LSSFSRKNRISRIHRYRKKVADLRKKAISLERDYCLLSSDITSLKRENSILRSLQAQASPFSFPSK
ncbi:5788_t:CDS:1, partial [Acaulospora morrowiae]